jgi:hypothetical protein
MFLNKEFLRLYEELATLNEAKADTQRLIDFAGEELANRFLVVKDKLKAPENDLYYWIKNKTVDELAKAVEDAENAKSNRQIAKEKKVNGAELVCESTHWNVYHITTFAASQLLGRDTTWCITGVNNYGDRYWKDYTGRGIEFYFLITKDAYDPRGTDSKIALAIYPNSSLQVFNQQDYEIDLDDVPHIEEVNIPGIDLDALDTYEVEDDTYAFCYICDCELDEDDAWMDEVGDYYCYDCWHERYFSCAICDQTFELDEAGVVDTDDGLVCPGCASKMDNTKQSSNKNYEYLDDPENTGYVLGIEGSNKKAENYDLHVEDALTEILAFINGLTQEEKDKVWLSWRCSSGEDPKGYEHFMDAYEGELIVSVYSPAESSEDRALSNYELAELKIRQALGGSALSISSFEYETFMYDKQNERSELTNYSIYLDDAPVVEKSRIALDVALKEITDYIYPLSTEEKTSLGLSWEWTYDDAEGDVVVGVFSKAECREYGNKFPSERLVSNCPEAEKFIKRALGIL